MHGRASALIAMVTVVTLAQGCSKSPGYAEPPASEYTATKVELAAPPVAETVGGASVSRGFMAVIGMRPLLGRWFIYNDFQPTGGQVAVISSSLWRRRFGGDPTIIGRPVPLNGQNAVIVGVMPETFEFPKGTAVWLPRR
jgi:putative ABC transport system permease protein